MMSPEEEIRDYARGLGIHRIGFARADDLAEDYERYLAFVSAGMHGAMEYLARNQEARRGIASEFILPGARSVVVCALGVPMVTAAGPLTSVHAVVSAAGGFGFPSSVAVPASVV